MRYPCLNVGKSLIGWIVYIDTGEDECYRIGTPLKTEQEAIDSFTSLLRAAANTLDAMQKSADQRDEKEV